MSAYIKIEMLYRFTCTLLKYSEVWIVEIVGKLIITN